MKRCRYILDNRKNRENADLKAEELRQSDQKSPVEKYWISLCRVMPNSLFLESQNTFKLRERKSRNPDDRESSAYEPIRLGRIVKSTQQSHSANRLGDLGQQTARVLRTKGSQVHPCASCKNPQSPLTGSVSTSSTPMWKSLWNPHSSGRSISWEMR